jgi:hypothetical protein
MSNATRQTCCHEGNRFFISREVKPPVLDAALHVFSTLPGHTSTREDYGQPVEPAAIRLPVPQTGFPTKKGDLKRHLKGQKT